MRWLYHVRPRGEPHPGGAYAPASLAREGFIHASYRDRAAESARLYFAAGAALEVLRVDPRRLDARVEIASTPRGPMPHVHGPLPDDAIVEVLAVDDLERAPDRVTGTRFGFLAYPGMTLLDLVGMYDPLARIATMGFDATSTCEIVGATSEAVWSRDGIAITASRVRPPLDGFDVVLVPGGHGAQALVDDADVVGWIAQYPPNRLLASVCTGALLLGAAGRLRGRRATTHASALGRLAAQGAVATRERVVDEGAIVTAGGVTSALDLGLHLVARLEGEETAAAIGAQMEMLA
jgi:cyclohexyl-isocyanide hydratase